MAESMGPGCDRLRLRGLQFFGRHGTDDWEQQTGRRFEIDIELELDLSAPAQSDRLADAVDYRAVFACARRVVGEEVHALIERVAGRLLDELLASFPMATAARVRVAKPEAPIGGLNAAAEVELRRTREEWNR